MNSACRKYIRYKCYLCNSKYMYKVLVFLSFFSVHSFFISKQKKKKKKKKSLKKKKRKKVSYFALVTNFLIFMFVNYAFICIPSGVCAFLYVYDLFGFKLPVVK